MPKIITICLVEEEREQLEQVRDTDKRPYMRERAASILKLAEGMSPRQVALKGLLRPRKPGTVYEWVKRYLAEGIAGLSIRPGRGRKPAYSDKYQSKQEAKEAILHTVRRCPTTFGKPRSRWSLNLIAQVCKGLRISTPSGLSRLLKRLRISYKRGRSHVHSPDPNYQQKLDLIMQCLLKAWYAPEKYVLLYQDEFTIYRQPTVARDYEQMGEFQPLARRSHKSDTEFRGMGALNAITGQVTYHQAYKTNVRQLTKFYDAITADYPQADTIYMVQDNWPVHYHPDLLIHLQSQNFQFPYNVPSNWPDKPSPKPNVMLRSAKPSCLSRYSNCPPMHHGQTLLKSCGDG